MTAGKGKTSKGKGPGRKSGSGSRKQASGGGTRRSPAKVRAKPPAPESSPERTHATVGTEPGPAALQRREEPAAGEVPTKVELSEGSQAALARMRGMETLEAAYEAWLELKLEHGAARLRFQQEQERLTQQGAFLVGAVRAAGEEASGSPGLVKAGASPLDGFLREAEEKVGRAREALARQEEATEAAFREALAEVRATIQDRVRRYLEGTRPKLELVLHRVGATRTILHARRVAEDDAVLLCYLLTGRIPTRYGFLFDDSTEDVSLPPPPLYAEEGVAQAEVRPDAKQLEARLREPGEVLPLKGFLPVFVPRPGGGEDFFRLLQRGPVMEAEVAEGGAFRHILAREEAERFAGHLLRLKLEGRIELDIQAV
jgi:hypothetical protein